MKTNLNVNEYCYERELIKAVAQDDVLQQLLTWSNKPRPDPSLAANLRKELQFYYKTWPSWQVD